MDENAPNLNLILPPALARSLALAVKVAEQVFQNNAHRVAQKGVTPHGMIQVLEHLDAIQKVMGPFPEMVSGLLSPDTTSTEVQSVIPTDGQVRWVVSVMGHQFLVEPVHDSPVGPALKFIGPRPINFPDAITLFREEEGVGTEKWILKDLRTCGEFLSPGVVLPA